MLRTTPFFASQLLTLWLTLLIATVSLGDSPLKPAELFEARVRPVLVRHCLKCHGIKKPRGGLRLDSRAAMLRGGDSGSSDNWDAHGDMQQHRAKARRGDQPLAALIGDLKRRGLLDSTLLAICTEFGRTPWSDNGRGRNHYARAFSSLLAGGGVKGGIAYGQTDQYGIDIIADGCHVHDYHATILHLMGIDHTRLTYRYAGRDFRLTDVAGEVMQKVLA